jgi:hypothetical protein
VAAELRSVVAAQPQLTHLTLVGNSLGGLYVRYAAALAYDASSNTVAGLRPVTLLTTATPHLGVGAFGYLGLVPRWLQATVGGRALGRTIAELLLQDAGPSGVPLLVRMASAQAASTSASSEGVSTEPPFLEALAAFQRRVAYANAENDFLVAYETAALRTSAAAAAVAAAQQRQAAAAAAARAAGSAHILYTVTHAATPAAPASPTSSDALALQRAMAAGLGTLAWTETAVRFPGVMPLAHNKIVALRRAGDPLLTWLAADGAPVVAHTAAALLADLERGGGARESVAAGAAST